MPPLEPVTSTARSRRSSNAAISGAITMGPYRLGEAPTCGTRGARTDRPVRPAAAAGRRNAVRRNGPHEPLDGHRRPSMPSTPPSRSLFHVLTRDEVWHAYAGDPFRLVLLHPDGASEDVVMGRGRSGGASRPVPGARRNVAGRGAAPGVAVCALRVHDGTRVHPGLLHGEPRGAADRPLAGPRERYSPPRHLRGKRTHVCRPFVRSASLLSFLWSWCRRIICRNANLQAAK